jgi:hypothetical protein
MASPTVQCLLDDASLRPERERERERKRERKRQREKRSVIEREKVSDSYERRRGREREDVRMVVRRGKEKVRRVQYSGQNTVSECCEHVCPIEPYLTRTYRFRIGHDRQHGDDMISLISTISLSSLRQLIPTLRLSGRIAEQ